MIASFKYRCIFNILPSCILTCCLQCQYQYVVKREGQCFSVSLCYKSPISIYNVQQCSETEALTARLIFPLCISAGHYNSKSPFITPVCADIMDQREACWHVCNGWEGKGIHNCRSAWSSAETQWYIFRVSTSGNLLIIHATVISTLTSLHLFPWINNLCAQIAVTETICYSVKYIKWEAFFFLKRLNVQYL